MSNNETMKRYLILTICFALIKSINLAQSKVSRPYAHQFRARTFLKNPADSGFRQQISEINKDDQHSFWRFLELYTDAEERNHQVRIMRDYYVSYSEEQYRLPALMFMYNAFDPLDPTEQKRMVKFLSQHFHENHVLGLFLYRYGTYSTTQPLSFTNLYRILKDRIRDFSFPDLESLHFMDLMISQEISESNFTQYRKLQLDIWRNEIVRQTPLYKGHRNWFQKVNSYSSLGQRFTGITPVKYSNYVSARRKFFRHHGYSGNEIIRNLELTFRLNDAAFRLPEFLPRMKVDPVSRIQDHRTAEDSPFIVNSTPTEQK